MYLLKSNCNCDNLTAQGLLIKCLLQLYHTSHIPTHWNGREIALKKDRTKMYVIKFEEQFKI